MYPKRPNIVHKIDLPFFLAINSVAQFSLSKKKREKNSMKLAKWIVLKPPCRIVKYDVSKRDMSGHLNWQKKWPLEIHLH